jgi:hypothetical protein
MVKKEDIIMGNFEFKSQICTGINQSRKLLALDQKKETVDMFWQKLSEEQFDIEPEIMEIVDEHFYDLF